MIGAFKDRVDAGKKLAAKVRLFNLPNPIVIALPRGGVPVGYEVAKALHAPLAILPVRKIGAPTNPELAIGALAEGNPPVVLLDDRLIEALRVSATYTEEETQRQLARIQQQMKLFEIGLAPSSLAGQSVIVVDDGVATGATTRVALRALRARNPASLVLAVPVGDIEVLERLRAEVDHLICAMPVEYLGGVGAFYRDFTQVENEVVVDLLQQAAARLKTPAQRT